MATRKVTVRIVLDGLAEYQNNIKAINAQNRVLQSELKLVDSQFKNNANSTEHLTARGKVLEKQIELQKQKVKELENALEYIRKAETSYASAVEKSRTKVDAARKALIEYSTSADVAEEEQKKLKKALADCEKELADNEAKYKIAGSQALKYTEQLNKAKIAQNQLEESLTSTNGAMEDMPGKTDAASSAAEMFAEVLIASGIKEGLEKIRDGLIACANASVEFETAFTNVSKTIDAPEEKLLELRDAIKDLATELPYTTTEISDIAAIAGQLGIGTDNILDFTKTVLGLGSATNIAAEDAARMLAQFGNIAQLDPSEYERFASTIVDLGNNFATTEADIMAMAQRLASTGATAGLTAPEMLGLATALSSLGINAEAGGSSISKMLITLYNAVETGDGLKEFAKVAGVSAKEFRRAWGESATGALQLFIQGLGDTERNGKSTIALVDELGLKEIRLRNTVLSLASADGVLEDAVSRANIAFEENNALAKETGKRYATTESSFKRFQNSVNNVKIAIGDALTPILEDLANIGTEAFEWLSEFIEDNPELVRAIVSTVAALGTLTAGFVAYDFYNKHLKESVGELRKALTKFLENGINPVAAAIAGAIAAFIVFKELTRDVGQEAYNTEKKLINAEGTIKGFTETLSNQVGAVEANASLAERYLKVIEDYEKILHPTNEQQEEYIRAIERLNELYPELNLQIDEETGKLKKSTEEIREQIDALKEKALVEALEDTYTNLYREKVEVMGRLAENVEKANEAEREYNEAVAEQSQARSRYNELLRLQNTLHQQGNVLTSIQLAELERLESALPTYAQNVTDLGEAYEEAAAAVSADTDALAMYDDKLRVTDELMGNATLSAEEIVTAFKNVGESTNQATEMESNARGSIQGYVNGVWQEFGSVEEAMNSMRTMTSMDMADEAKEDGEAFVAGYVNGIRIRRMSLSDMMDLLESDMDMSHMSAEGKTDAENWMDGLISGINRKYGKYTSLLGSIASAASTTFRSTNKIQSPSRVAMEDAGYWVEGLIVGIDDKAKEYEKAMSNLGSVGIDSFNTSIDNLEAKAPNVMQTVTVAGTNEQRNQLSTLVNLLTQYLPELANMQMVTDTGAMVGELAPKLDRYMAGESNNNRRGQ